MRLLALVAFVLDGVAAVGYVAVIAMGDRHVTPLGAFVLVALLAGFFCALATVVGQDARAASDEATATLLIAGASMFDNLTEDAKDDVRQHFPHPERRQGDRRRGDATSHEGPDRRTTPERRELAAEGAPPAQGIAAAIDQELAPAQ